MDRKRIYRQKARIVNRGRGIVLCCTKQELAAHFHGLWSQRVMSIALKRASDLVFDEMEKQDRVLGRAQ